MPPSGRDESTPPPSREAPSRPAAPGPPLRARAAAALAWRGPDGRGPSVGAWLLAAAFAWAVAAALAPYQPALVLAPPLLALAALLPGLQRLLALARRTPAVRRPFASVEPWAAAAFFAAVTWQVLGFVLRNRIPIDTGDHQIMMTRAEIFSKALAHGRIAHWTHNLQGGDALVDLYPIFANYVSAAFYFLTPKGVPFVVTYTTMVVAAWWFRGVALYCLARRFAGPAVSLALSLAGLYEVGDNVTHGVWDGTIYWGMIHNNIALSIGALATAAQVDLTRRVTSGRVAFATVATSLTAFAHPLGLIYSAMSTAALALAALFSHQRRRRVVWATVAAMTGTAMAAVWVMPYTYGLRNFGFRYANPAEDYVSMGRGLFDGTTPTSSFTAFIGFGLVAVTAAVTARRAAVVATGVVALAFWLLSLTPLLTQLRFFDLVPSFLDGQMGRMLTVLKTAAVPSLAWMLARAYRHVRLPGSLRVGDVLGRAVLLGLLLLGPARAVGAGLNDAEARLRSKINGGESGGRARWSHTDDDYDKVFAWLKAQREADKSPTPWRASIHWDREMKHAAWAEGDRTGVPIVDFLSIPANFLGIKPREISAAGFRDWNIRYAVTNGPKPPFAGMAERLVAGRFHVWEAPDYDDRYVVAPPGISVSGLAFEGDAIRFRVDGAPPGGADVVVRNAWFPRWRAKLDGAPVAVRAHLPRPEALPQQEQLLAHVTNGEVVFTCDGTMPRFWPGLATSLSAALAFAAFARRSVRQRLESRARALLGRAGSSLASARDGALAHARRRPRAAAAGAALFFAACLLASRRGVTRLTMPPVEGYGLDVSIGAAGGGFKPCGPAWWRGRYSCRAGEKTASVDGWVGRDALIGDTGEDPKLWPGLRLNVREANTAVRLRFPRVRLAQRSLAVKFSTYGKFQMSGSIDGRPFPPQPVDSTGLAIIPVPEGVPANAEVVLEFESTRANAEIDISGFAR